MYTSKTASTLNKTANTLQTLYDTHFSALLRQARYLCGDDQAQDLVLETLYHAADHLDNFRGGSERAWLCVILRNRFLSECRRPCHVPLDSDLLPDRRPDPQTQALERLFVQEALDYCHDPDLFQAATLDGESLTDLARQSGENLNTLTARSRRDRQRLRAHFARL